MLKRKNSMSFKRCFAIILCVVCVFAGVSTFFGVMSAVSESDSSDTITITFTQGSDVTEVNSSLTLFSDTTKSVTTNVSGCLVVPETYFSVYGESTDYGDLAISISLDSSHILDCETFYFDSTVTSSSWAYSFTGWKISVKDESGDETVTDKIPEQTVFQPGDVITPDILEKYASGGTLTLEALWGKCYFIQNAYETMVYTQNSDGYYELDTSKSSDATGASDDNTGNDPALPKATIDGLYADLRGDSTKTAAFVDYDAYATVVMLTGDLNYYKDNNVSTTYNGYGNYYYYYGYGSETNYYTNNNINASTEYVSATYKSLQATRSYNDTDEKWETAHSSDTMGTKYNYYFKGRGNYDYVYGNIRLDNILFRKTKSGDMGGVSTSEFQLYYPSGDEGVHYFEATARYNVYTSNGSTAYITSTEAGFSSFRTANHEYIVLNGGQIGNMEFYWSSNVTNTARYWYIGRLACINNYVTVGCTTTGESLVYTVKCDMTITVTGGTVGSITGSSKGMNAISVGDRTVNIYGDGSAHVSSTTGTMADYEYNPYITNLFGGGYTSPLYGDVTVTAKNCSNLVNVYGGGRDYSATTYGNVTLNITNCNITENLYGGGMYANVEKIPGTYTQYTYSNNEVSSSTQNISNLDSTLVEGHGGDVEINISGTIVGKTVYGSGMGQTQTISVLSSEIYTGNSGSYTLEKTDNKDGTWSYDYKYPSNWEDEPTFPKYDSTTGYVLIGSYKYITWSTASPTAVNFRRYDYYAYLSLATVENVEINITDGSTIKGDVYGGGSIAKVLGNAEVNIKDSTVEGTVYGGGDGATTPSTVTVYQTGSGCDWKYEVTEYDSATGTPTKVTCAGTYNGLTSLTKLGTFTWSGDESVLTNSGGIDKTNNLLYSPNTSGLGAVYGNTSVTVSGNSDVGAVYGGGNQGAVYGNITVTVTGGKVGTIYGGCKAADVGKSTNADSGNITVTISSVTLTSVYGGNNASGTIYGKIKVSVSGNTTITSLYGGGNLAIYTGESITVNVTGGVISNFFGGGLGSDTDATAGGVTAVYINISQAADSTTTIGNLFGGGNMGPAGSVTITVESGTITFLYSGGNKGNVTGNTSVTISGGTFTNVYGGGFEGSVGGSASVNISGGTIGNRLYGGGFNGAVTGNTSVTVSGGTTPSVYGGGFGSSATVGGYTTVTVSGGKIIGDVYGGGNEGAVTGNTTVIISQESGTTTISGSTSGDTTGSVYGGGYGSTASVGGNTSVTISGGSVTKDVYGGGYAGAVTGSSTVELSNSPSVGGSLFGGGYSAGVGSASVSVGGGAITGDVYGGGNEGAVSGNISVAVSGGTITGTLYGGCNMANVSGTITVNVTGGTITTLYGANNASGTVKGDVYGGGYSGNVTNSTVVTVNCNVTGSIYGGGFEGDIGTASSPASTTVSVTGGTIASVYGGGYAGDVYGTASVSISDSDTTTTIISGSVYGAGYGAEACVTSGTTVTINLSYQFTASEAPVYDGTVTSGETKTTITGGTAYTSVIKGSVYGGGNLGTVGVGTVDTSTNTASISSKASTAVMVVSGHIEGSVYGGGYGVPASGSYNVYMGTVFGSTAVTIAGSSDSDYIYVEKNIFGGGSQSRVYAESGGTAAAVSISSASGANIAIGGSVFGGGERGNSATTNASVPTTIGNVSVDITGNGTSVAATIYFVSGGVYGDGNLCLVNGTRTISITNFITGSSNGSLKTFYSLQRADKATLSNSKIVLLGAVDLVAEGDNTTYSINRIDSLALTNGSTIKLDRIVNYLGALSSDVYSERTFVNKGVNSGSDVSALTDDEVSNYITQATAGNQVLETTRYANTVCVANGLSLELKNTNGNYGAVTGLFTLSLLLEIEGEGGGFVYASIAESTGDFICITKFSNSNDYMKVADDVGGYVDDAPTYYYWYIQGSTINYIMEVTGYIGSDVTDYEDSGTVTRHSVTRYYVLNSVSVGSGSALESAVTNNTYTLATSSTGLSGQQIAIEVKLGSASLGFLYYDSTNGWGIYQSSAKYGTENGGTASANTLLSTTVTSSNDTLYFVLHKSSEVSTEISEMELTITIEIYVDNNDSIGDIVSGDTNKLVIAGTVNISRLVPTQTIYKTSGKNYAGIDVSVESINITMGSSFTVQYQTNYIPAAFPTGSGSMTWAISTQAYYYYFDSTYGTYMTLNSSGYCVNISSTLYFTNPDSSTVGSTSGVQVQNDGTNYYYMHDMTKITFSYTEFAASSIPAGTKITMIDLTGTSTDYYYYVCSESKTYIALDDFCKMGTGTKISDLSSSPAFMAAYNNTTSTTTQVVENLIFIFDFEDVDYDELGTAATGSLQLQLQHLYNSVDIMDFVKSTTKDEVTTYTRSAPKATEYTISTEAGYTLEAEFTSDGYYDLDTAELTVTITPSETDVNTLLLEYECALKIELVDSSGTVYNFPVGMEFEYNGTVYDIAADGSYVIIPLGTLANTASANTFVINIINELYSLKSIAGSTAYFKITLYSAPDASYYDYISWSSVSDSYTIYDNLTYALSVTPTAIVEGITITYSQVLAADEMLTFTVKTACSGTSSEKVSVSLMVKTTTTNEAGEEVDVYADANLSDLFTDSVSEMAASEGGAAYTWKVSASAKAGTYRLVFTYADHVEYLNVIVYE